MSKLQSLKKNKTAIIFVILILAFFFFFKDSLNLKRASAAWYSTGGTWTHRKQITVDHGKVSGSANLTDFPMLFKVTDADLKHTDHGGNMGKVDATDLLFTSSDGSTKLSHEIEYYASTTGEIVAWVKVPTLLATQDTLIYAYFGNSGASDQQDTANVWDSNYKGVWHVTDGTTLSGDDSTSNALDITFTSSSQMPYATAGKIDGAANFDAANLYNGGRGETSTVSISNTDPWSLSGWINWNSLYTTEASHNTLLWSEGRFNTQVGSALAIQRHGETNGIRATVGDGNIAHYATSNSSAVSTGVWYYIAAVWDTSVLRLYIDGSEVATTSAPSLASLNNTKLEINSGLGHFDDFKVDEIRIISGFNRTADWIATEYNNQNSPSTFYSYGALNAENRIEPATSVKGGGTGTDPTVKVRGGVKFR